MKLVSGLAAAVLLLVLAAPVAASDPTPVPPPPASDCAVSSDGAITCPADGGGSSGSGSTDPSQPVDPGLSPEPVPSLLIEPAPSTGTIVPMLGTCSSNPDGTVTCSTMEPAMLPSCEPIAVDPNAPDASAAAEGGVICATAAMGQKMYATDAMGVTTTAGVAESAMLVGAGESIGLLTVGLVAIGTLLGAIVGVLVGFRLRGSHTA